MNHTVWPQGTKDGTFFTGMLLMSSVHLDSINSGTPSPVTTTLKLEAMRLVREKIQVPTSDAIISCISAIACLATCALVSPALSRGEVTAGLMFVLTSKPRLMLSCRFEVQPRAQMST